MARTEEEITTILMALVAWGGQTPACARYLEEEKGIKISSYTLKTWMTDVHAARYDELREKYADQLETRLANDLLEVSAYASRTVRLAVEQAAKRLEAGKDQDPGRTAANLARVSQASIDKRMTLTGRPKEYADTRDAMEMLRSLTALGLLRPMDEPKQISEATEA